MQSVMTPAVYIQTGLVDLLVNEQLRATFGKQ